MSIVSGYDATLAAAKAAEETYKRAEEDDKKHVSEESSIFDTADDDNIDANNLFTGKSIFDTENINDTEPVDNDLSSEIASLFPDAVPTITILDDGTKQTEFFNDDGSGFAIIETFGDNPVKNTILYDKGFPVKSEMVTDDQTAVFEYAPNSNMLAKSTIYKYYPSCHIINTTTISEYYPNSNNTIAKTTTTSNLGDCTETTYYDPEERITRQEKYENKTQAYKDKNGKMAVETISTTETTEFRYNPDGKKIEEIKTLADNKGEYTETITQYSPDDESVISLTNIYYNNDAKTEEKYYGSNIEKHNGMPSEKIEYEPDGQTIKQRTINHFDEDGVLIGRDVYDKDDNKIETYDFSGINKSIELSYQVGRGDCYLLSTINSLAVNETGHRLLQQNIQVSENEEGKEVYTVTLPGAAEIREQLIDSGIPEEQISIQGSYTVTEDELNDAAKIAGQSYSIGDKDVLLLELVYEKFREDVVKTKENNEDNSLVTDIYNAEGFYQEIIDQGDYLSGGFPEETIYILTGKKPVKYSNFEDCPACYVDDNLQLHITDSMGYILEDTNADPNSSAYMLTDMTLTMLEKDCTDGKLNNFGATAALFVTTQENHGKAVNGGWHAFSITNVDSENVYLSNPWRPDTTIIMPRDVFVKAARDIAYVPYEEDFSLFQIVPE